MTVIKTFSLQVQPGTFQGPFYSAHITGAAGVLPGCCLGEDCICLLTGPPLCCAHQADWSAMWGGCTTARRAPLYGSSSFYTCCITVKDKQHTYWGSNYRVSKQQAFCSVTLTGERAARRFDSSRFKAASYFKQLATFESTLLLFLTLQLDLQFSFWSWGYSKTPSMNGTPWACDFNLSTFQLNIST